MAIQFDNTNTGVATLKPATSGTIALTLPAADGTSGQALTTNGSGQLAFSTVGGGGGSSLTIKDEGTTLTSAATSIDFTGAGVTATNVGGDVTVTIAGGGGGGSTSPKSLLDSWMIGAM